ncbi:AN13A protein, partial [Piaya cayana]|nr:AN13A protein [Piaya cayana]
MSSPGRASSAFPLHVLVWNNDYRRLDEELQDKVMGTHGERGAGGPKRACAVLHEAVSTGDPEMLQMILQHRDYQQTAMTLGGVPELLQKINEAASVLSFSNIFHLIFFFFHFLVPLVSRVCPSDVCRIWKSGAKLRVDITLLGFENMNWERGRRSLIFKGEDTGGWAELIEINHDDKYVTTKRFEISQHMKRLTLGSMTPKRKDVERRLTSPIISTCLDTKNIAFERTTSGFWVWRTEKAEAVNGYEAKV